MQAGVRPELGWVYFFFAGGGGGGGGLTEFRGLEGLAPAPGVVEFEGLPMGWLRLLGARFGSLAMTYSWESSPVFISRNSTISTSSPGTRMTETPVIGICPSSVNHSASAILKCPWSGRLGHSSGHP